MTKDNQCKINHVELAIIHEDCQGNKGNFHIKCNNRLCYNNKLRDSDYCLQHHLRDEHD